MSYIGYLLHSLNRENGGFRFEALATDLVHATYASNIVPATGPIGPGDRGEDGRSHAPYLLDSADMFRIWRSAAQAPDRTFFAFSIDVDWKNKLSSDVDKIVSNRLGAEKIVFVTNQLIPTRDRQNAQSKVQEQYGIPTEILDGNWIALHLEGAHYTLAVKHLGADRPADPNMEAVVERVLELRVGGMSAEDAANLERLENDVRYRTDYEARRHQLVLDLKSLGDILSKYHEHLDTAIKWYEEALHEASQIPDKVIVADVYYAYFRALYRTGAGRQRILERLPEYITLIEENDIVDYFEKIHTWLLFLVPASADGEIDSSQHTGLMHHFQEFLDSYDITRRSFYVQARVKEVGLWLQLFFIAWEHDDVIPVFTALSTLLDDVSDIEVFPVGRVCARLAVLSPAYGGIAEYEALYNKAERITGERESKFRAAELRQSRAIAHLDRDEWGKATYHLGIAKTLWLGDETLRGTLLSALLMARCYRELGLFHAAKYEVAQCVHLAIAFPDQRHLDLVSAAYAELHWAALKCGYVLSAVEAGVWHVNAAYVWRTHDEEDDWSFTEYFEKNLSVILPRLLISNRALHDEILKRLPRGQPAFDLYREMFLTTDEEFEALFSDTPDSSTARQLRMKVLGGELEPVEDQPILDEVNLTRIEFVCSEVNFAITYERDYGLALAAETFAAFIPFVLLSKPELKSDLAWVEDTIEIAVAGLDAAAGYRLEHVPNNLSLSVRLSLSRKAALGFREPPFDGLLKVSMSLLVMIADLCTITPTAEVIECLDLMQEQGVFDRLTKQAPYGWTVHNYLPRLVGYEEVNGQEADTEGTSPNRGAARGAATLRRSKKAS